MSVSKGWSIPYLDVKNAFLHGVLQKEAYMTQQTGFFEPRYPNHVCRLHNELYGLKQNPRA